ncbi:replication endonuclease [Pseudomonas fildesensis]|uniref:replication endonuclease n=1 Tax=Pseudomonas fildesensis TaxID=1674920 RepID=UPI0009E2B1D6|nr:replication endonuclease [Pseudomonas fildesensis]
MKTTHTSIVSHKNKSQALTQQNIAEVKANAELFQNPHINASELVAKLKVVISQLNPLTRTFEFSSDYRVESSLPFVSDEEAEDLGFIKIIKLPTPKFNVLRANKKQEFSYQEKIENYATEALALAKTINRLFDYLRADEYLKQLILVASADLKSKSELNSIEIYKNVRFSDLRCSGTVFDKLYEFFVDDEGIRYASDRSIYGKENEGKDKCTFRRLAKIVKAVARKQREMHLLKNRKIGWNDEAYCSNELLGYQREKDIEQQEFIDNTEIVYTDDKGKEQKIPLSKFALTDERKASEIYMKVKDLEKVAESKGYIALFTTFTCPAEFHSNPKSGRNCWDGSTPREASDWLSTRLVALNKDRERHEIETLGMWCKEAHKDQCVHMHSMFFVRPDQAAELIALIHKHYSHSENAVRIVFISDEEAKKSVKKGASPATYITKYVIKSLREKSDESMKNKAVARLWGYRMYGFFGKTQTILWRAFDRFFDKEPSELMITFTNIVFVQLAKFRQDGKFWAFCEYANEFIQTVIIEHDEMSWSGFEFIRKVKWGYRVKGTDDCLQTKFECSLRTNFGQ